MEKSTENWEQKCSSHCDSWQFPLHQDWQPGRQTLSRNTAEMHSTVNQLDMMDTQGTFHLTVAEYTFFSRSHAARAVGDNILSYKTYLNNNNGKIIQSMLPKSYLSEFKLNGVSYFVLSLHNLTLRNRKYIPQWNRKHIYGKAINKEIETCSI